MTANESLQRRVRRLMNHWATELVVAALIVVSVGLVLVEAALAPSNPYFQWVVWTNHAITGVFIVELSIRFYAEKRRTEFFRKYWYDILAVIPLFRAVRFLRVLRLLRLFRFGVIAIRRLSRFSRVFRHIRVEYVILAFFALTMVLMGGLSMRYAEPGFESAQRALWYAVMTVIAGEPIGGEPGTMLGRVVTVTMMLGGVTVFAVLTGTVSAVMIDTLRDMNVRPMALDDLENHAVVCGWNQAGPLVVEELIAGDQRMDHIVVVSEREGLEEEPILRTHRSQVFVLQGDYTRIDVLREAGIERASYALLLADTSREERSPQDRDARTVLAAMLIEKINVDIYTAVQLMNRDNESSLKEIGVEEIIVSDEYVGNIMATVTQNRGIVRMLDELLTAKWGNQFYREPVPEEYVGRTVGDVIVDLKSEYGATLLGVDAGGGEDSIRVNPPTDYKLEAGHELIVAASEPLESSNRNS